VEEQTLPLLFGSLPDRAPPRDVLADRAKYQRTLHALHILCQPPALFDVFVIRLTTKLDILGTPTSVAVDKEATAAYAHSILLTILQTLTAKVDEKHSDVPRYIERLLPRLFNLFIYAAYTSEDSYSIYQDPRLLQTAGQIITLVLETAPLE
jgi:DNA repair/transcription protein MET18/MMS19